MQMERMGVVAFISSGTLQIIDRGNMNSAKIVGMGMYLLGLVRQLRFTV